MSRLRCFMLFAIVLFVFVPAVAQTSPSTSATISFNGIEFTYLPEAFGAVLATYDEGTPYAADAPYFANVAPHLSFKFYRPNTIYPDRDWVGELRVYRISDLETYPEPSYMQVVEQLRGVSHTDLSTFATVSADYLTPSLPFMPVLNATQVFRAHPESFDCATASGIEYYAYYAQGVEPIVEGQILYTYQGITADSTYYFSFSMPVELGQFEYAVAENFDWTAFQADYSAYLDNVFSVVNGADPETFSPSASSLERFVESITTNALSANNAIWTGITLA